jgi:hypothetical protein
MSKPKMTPWFSVQNQPPALIGWYEFRGTSLPHRRYWTGSAWVIRPGDTRGVEVYPWDEYRGLTAPEAKGGGR